MKLSSSALSWYEPVNPHLSSVKPLVKAGSLRIDVRNATVRPDKHGIPPSALVIAAQSKFLLSRYSAPKKFQHLCDRVGFSARRRRWHVTTPPYCGCSKGANNHCKVFRGQSTSSSAKTMIGVVTSGTARAIWRRLLACLTDIQRSRPWLFAGILWINPCALYKLSSIVTRINSLGSFRKIDWTVRSNSGPSPSRVGRMTVTSSGYRVGFSGIGIGLNDQNRYKLMIKRKYR